MSNGDSQSVGLFLDFENLVLAFHRAKGLDPAAVKIGPVVEFLEENFGNVIFRRSYADWSDQLFGEHEKEHQDLGVEMIHVCRRTRQSKKNGADILLTADAVECLLLRPYISAFAIISGDSDIGPLITKLRSHGKTVVVVGPDQKSTARHVIELADRFKFYTDIVQPKKSERGPRHPKTPQEQVVELLRDADGPLESADLKRRLIAIPRFGSFQEKALGFKTWTSFLRSIDEVKIRRRSDLGVEVELES